MLRILGVLPAAAAVAILQAVPASGSPADSLLSLARAHLARGTFDSRRLAVGELDEASRLMPGRADLWLEYAHAAQATGQRATARQCLERAAAIAPQDSVVTLALGRAWKQDWLASFDDSSYVRALRWLMAASARARRDPGPRVEITALALAEGDVLLAERAAESAASCDPDSPDCLLARGCAAYRAGDLARADSAFSVALPRLPRAYRRRFTDLSPIEDTDDRGGGEIETASYWRIHDPDLTTPENEAELSFMARVAHALLLFRDDTGPHWDMRAELFVRYGVPQQVAQASPDRELALAFARYVPNGYAPPPLEYPYQVQVWNYPDLGISVELWDRGLGGRYDLPPALEHDPDPRPDPARLARRADLVVLGGGRGVLHALAPGTAPLVATADLSRFPADSLVRLVAHVASPGGPADSMTGLWAVADANGRTVARGSGELATSACDPAEQRATDFAAALPPGDYRVDVAVRRGSGRAVLHLATSLRWPPAELALSDLVLVCGEPLGSVPLRIEPNVERRVSGSGMLNAYFEVSRLRAGPDGRARFRYTYTVRPATEGRHGRSRREPAFEASREAENVGPLRRQFVSVPLKSLGRGAWQLDVLIQDLVSGSSASATASFVKE